MLKKIFGLGTSRYASSNFSRAAAYSPASSERAPSSSLLFAAALSASLSPACAGRACRQGSTARRPARSRRLEIGDGTGVLSCCFGRRGGRGRRECGARLLVAARAHLWLGTPARPFHGHRGRGLRLLLQRNGDGLILR